MSYLAPALRPDLGREMRQQDKRRFTMPDLRDMDPDTLKAMQSWYVVMVWTVVEEGPPEFSCEAERRFWSLAGFVRRRNRRKVVSMNRMFAGIRRKCGIDRDEPVRVVDLVTAHRNVLATGDIVHTDPPQHYETTRPDGPLKNALERPVVVGGRILKVTVQRSDVKLKPHKIRDTSTPASKGTKYIAIGEKIGRVPGIYLGPLRSSTKAAAQREADHTWASMYDITVYTVAKLDAKYRRRIRNGKLVPGYTRVNLSTFTPRNTK